MKFRAKILVAVSLFSSIVLAAPVFADDVTLTGTLSFNTLDGSAQDHDGTANGVFTVNDGDLVIGGIVQCNDDPPLPQNAGACPIAFNVSGDLIVEAGGAIFAENRRGGGKGGNISLTVGGNLILRGPSVVSSSRTTDSNAAAGNITAIVQGNVELEAGSIVAASTLNGSAGTIEVTADGTVAVAGLVAAGPSRQVLGTKLTGKVLNGGSSNQVGGAIVIRSYSPAPAIRVEGSGIIVSQGESAGSQLVLLEGCGLEVRGLVASALKSNGPSQVVLRSGESLLIDGRDLGSATPNPGRLGRVRADGTEGGSAGYMVDLFTQGDIQVLGPDPVSSTLFAVSSSPGTQAQRSGGTITSISLAGALTASGNAFEAGRSSSGNQGGTIDLEAKGDVALDGATLKAVGGFASSSPARKGGQISVRSFAGALSWTFGVGDVRPVGSGAPVSTQGAIALTACSTVDTTGTQFPTVGSAILPFPVENEGVCSPTAPSLPNGEPPLPSCIFNEAPMADDDAYSVDEGGTLNVAAPGVLDGDTDADGDPLTAVLVSGPAHASSFILNTDGSFSYTHDGSETTSDSFTYKANDGTADSNVATVTITIDPVNDVPEADDDAYNVNEGGTLNVVAPGVLDGDTDGDGDSLTAVLVSGPAQASSFALNADGSFSYTHNGGETTSDSFTYKANDGTADSNVATVTITIAPVNDVPVADDDAYNVNEGGTLNVPAPGVLDGDTDGDGDSLSAVLEVGPAHASSFALNADGSFSYTHDGSETLTDSFTYKANDGTANSLPATVTITIAPVNDPPSAHNDEAATDENTPITILVLANDSDPEGGSLTIVSTGGTPAGAVINNGNNISYDPTAAFNSLPPNAVASDTFTYTIQDAGGLQSTATVTVTINGLNDNPTADDETYSAIGNTRLAVQKTGPFDEPTFISSLAHVLEGDTDPDTGDSVSAVAFSGTLPSGAVLDLASDGTFFYTPPAGQTTPDTFTYTVQDSFGGTDTGTVTVNFAKMVWYVDNTSGTPNTGSGTSTDPFSTLSDAENASAAGHILYIFRGDGTDNLLNQGITLKNQQKLWGQGVDLAVDPDDGGPQPSATLFEGDSANRPQVTNGSGNAVTVLANAANGSLTGIEIRGLSLSSTAAGFNAVDATSADAANLELKISENLVTGAPAEGIDINAGSTGTATIAVYDNALTAAGTAIDIQRTAGILVIAALGGNNVSGDTGGSGIIVTGPATFNSTSVGGAGPVSGGNTVIGASGNPVGGAGLALFSVTGALDFGDLDIFAGGGAGISLTGTGAYAGAIGTRMTVPNGMGIIESANGPGVDVSNATIDLRLATLTVSASPTTGVSLVNVSDGSVPPTSAFFSAGSTSTIAGVTGTDFNVDGGNATVSYAGSINNTAGRSVAVQNRTGDSVTFANTSTITDNGTGILVNANAAGAVTDFLGTLTMSTGANNAFAATSGGTLRVMGATNTIATATGVALNVTNTTIGTGGAAPETGLRFRSISAGTAASGPANGIVLNNTGVLGGLTVTGDGGGSNNGSGGVIQNTTAEGIQLNSTANVSLGYLNITNSGTDSIRITNINGFTLNRSNIDDAAGTAPADKAIDVGDFSTGTAVNGAINITNNVIGPAAGNSPHDSLAVGIGSGTSTWNVANNLFRRTGNSGINLELRGTAVVSAFNVNACTFAGAGFATSARGIFANNLDDSVMTLLTIQNSNFTNDNIHIDINQQNDTDPVGSSEFAILNNTTMTGARSHAINVFSAAGTFGGGLEGTISGNTIGNAGVAGSGSAIGNGIRINVNGGADSAMLVNSNTIRQTPNGRGIEVIARNGAGGLDVTVTNNDVNPQAPSNPLAAILVQSNCLTVCNTVRADVRGNTVPSATDVTDLLTTYIELVESSSSTLELVDTTAPISGTCASELSTTNTGSSGVLGGCALIAGPIVTP